MEGHAAVLEVISFSKESAIDAAERYLQVLSLTTNPSDLLIRGNSPSLLVLCAILIGIFFLDILKLADKITLPKLHETALLSVAALTKTFAINSNDPANTVNLHQNRLFPSFESFKFTGGRRRSNLLY